MTVTGPGQESSPGANSRLVESNDEKSTNDKPKNSDNVSDNVNVNVNVNDKDKENSKAKGAHARPEREATVKDYLRVFGYATKWDYVLMLGAGIASIGAGTTLPLMNVVFGQVVGGFKSYFGDDMAQAAADFESQVNRLALYMLAIFVARFGLNYINKFCFRLIGIRMSAAIRLHYLCSLFSQTIHVLDSMPTGAAAGTITSTSNTLQIGISEKLGVFLEWSSTIVTAIIVAFTYSWSLTLVTASVIVFIVIVISILLPLIIKGHSRLTKAEAKGSAIAAEAFAAIRMVASCGAESRVSQRYSEWVKKAKEAGQFTSPFVSTQFGLIFFGLYGAFALAFWYGMKSMIEGRINNVGTVIIVMMSVMLMVMSLERISTPLIAVSKAMVAAAEFFAVIDAPQPKQGTLREPDVSADQDIVFEGVHFAYPSRPTKKVLDDLNLRIKANQNTAIVGPSGSGKSTIVGLIEGWYTLHDQYVIAKAIEKDKMKEMEKKKKKKEKEKEKRKKSKKSKKEGDNANDGGNDEGDDDDDDDDEDNATLLNPEDIGPAVELKGSISTCGHRLDDINIKWWRTQIGLVQQEPFLFNDTIYNNVTAGLIGSQWEKEPEEVKRQLVKEACAESFADEFIDRLPDGYDTQVGDSGAKLSGGQRQRIAIARSIISKPKILILDEATSAIDVRGERIVQAALERASKGRTTITIAHRLSTIKNADQICVLQNGRVAEQGTHESLLEREGVYYGLVHAQKLSLGDDGGAEEPIEDEDINAVLSREKSAAISDTDAPAQGAKWKERSIFTGFGKLLAEQKSRYPLYVIAVIGAAGAGAAVPMQAYLFAQVIVVFSETGDSLLNDVTFWSKMWVVLATVVGFSYFTMMFVSTTVEHHISAAYRQEYFQSILFQKTSYFDQEGNSTGQLTARLLGDPQQLKELLGINLMMMLLGVFSLVGALAISFAYGWKLALVALCVTVPLCILAGYYRMRYELQFNAMNEVVFAESSKFGAESIGAFRTVSSLVMEDSIAERYSLLLSNHVSTAYKKARWTTVIFAFADSVSLGCQALILWYGTRLITSGEYSVISFLVTYMAIIQGAESAGQWLSFGPNAAQASAAANRILEARENRIKDLVSVEEQVPDTAGGVEIELRNIHFKYPTRDVSVFKGLSITIQKGQFAALVGASGSGKTSIVSLLERFYDVTQGQILFNGKDITQVNLYEYRKLLSLVAQESALFQGTIRENVLLGVDPSEVTEEQMHQCCKDASIHDFIVSLPDGYNTNIGARGVNLSGGQKQRISIARALIRDPRVLLLDEATSSLDSASEKLVQAAFERVAKGRTTVAVAHRLATIQNADIIYVLGEGKVLESGSHSELLKKKGVYWTMCHNQALDR
ncbi:P-loop containing nucleoside triphosphate hydrolase protein [Lasiosphaeria miniovina]|uniref:P-loop containing nucleoside triphosphate hydrolase protein n=1 Tax=Lasiosphaeria miniovina TaxID=1954250 RepID=A0AA40EE48_9PEZI|nr:P-loop containing nucleoside triphosphate hydrolase protein [Lasiosphaeria miniovina]KAK0734121.1 P-loop containing nucleoside triphosphate hydrolase protein [Lasiosphaeria miniovina]